ncbi:MAG TPA: hypothetical protein VKT78_05270 [Fimbriimonadaceae bacterium]|nr:hypothetical protein [Fimbriimonadaceae bacterium]
MSSPVWHRSGRRRAGTSLIEVLVVIVVFMVGILALAQIFPGGFKILARTRDASIGNALGRNVSEVLRAHPYQLPDMIAPLDNNGNIFPGRSPLDFSIFDENQPGFVLNANGSFIDGGNTYSNYALYAGPNVFRQIFGEGQIIPAPRTIGNYFGGLMVLQFGPTRQLSPTETSPIAVYGNDYEVEVGPIPAGFTPGSRAYISDPNAAAGTLSVTVDDPATNPFFRLTCSIYTQLGATVYRRDVVAQQIQSTGGNTVGSYMTIPLSSLAPVGETYLSIDPNSVQIQRLFTAVPAANPFSLTDPYQYKVLNLHMGVLLFSPLGYNYYIVRASGQREPLKGRVDYQVQDWRIISDQFRLDDNEVDYKLSLGSLKVLGTSYADSLPYPGVGVQTLLTGGALTNTDVVFQDVQTGGLLIYDATNPQGPPTGNTLNDINIDPTQSSFYVDKSNGSFRIVDNDAATAGNQVLLALPDPTSPTGFDPPIKVNANGRTVRVLYQAKNEWAVAPLLAAAVFHEVPASPTGPGAAQYTVGAGNTRIYFPNMDVGRKVSVDLAYYTSSADANIHTMENQAFVVRNVPADPNGPYIDLREADGNALAFDFSHGFAVRGVRGVSVAVRAYNNPTAFSLSGAVVPAVQAYDSYSGLFRTITTETFMARGGN